MKVYFLTVLAVMLFSWLAQSADQPYSSQNGLQVQHSQATGFFYFLAILVLVLVSGLRYKVGTDYGAYYYGYKEYARSLGKAILTLSEPGYPLISRIAILIHDDGATAIFLAALVTIWPAMKVIYRHTDRLLLTSLLFIFLGCWGGSFNGVRQYLAATMLFCGYEALEARNLRKYLFWVFIAFLFHRSAIVMAALFFVVYRKVNTRNLLLIFFGSILVLLLYGQVLTIAGWITESDYSLKDEYAAHAVNTLRVLAACAPAVVFVVLLWNKRKDEQITFYLNLLVLHAAFCVATMNSALLYRIGIYTTLFQVLAIPELLKRVNPTTRKAVTAAMVPLFAIFWWYEISHGEPVVFRFIWERAF